MKNKCRKGFQRPLGLLVVLFILTSVLTACVSEESNARNNYDLEVLDHTSDFYVNDFAGVFSEAQKNELMEKAVAFDKEYSGVQVVITTVESLDSAVLGYEDAAGNRVDASQSTTPKFTIEEVAYSMYSQYGIGQDDMGILILFSTGDREVRIETGRQMQYYITDSVSGRLLDDYGMEYFREDLFAEGLISVQDATISKIKSAVPSDWYTSSKVENTEDSQKIENDTAISDEKENSDENVATNEDTKGENSGNGILWGLFGSIAAAFAAIVAFISQKIKGKTERKNLEETLQKNVNTLKKDHKRELDRIHRDYKEKISALECDYLELISKKDEELLGKEDQIHKQAGELSEAKSVIKTLTGQIEGMTDTYNRVKQLHPEYDFDAEVCEMIESERKATAQKIDFDLAEVLNIPADKDNYDIFDRALVLFDTTLPEIKKYITSSRDEIQKLYDEAIRLRKEFERAEQEKKDKAAANEAYKNIKKLFNDCPQGNYKTYDALHAALAIFLGLSVAQKAFFPDNKLIENLKRAHHSAETDHHNYEEAKEAERQVQNIIGSMYSADEDDRDRLERAMRYYRNLTSAQQAYFSAELLRKLKKLIEDANEDHIRQNRRRDEERRRAQQQMRSSSSFGSSHRSSFGGHGGRPSGGGASRRF